MAHPGAPRRPPRPSRRHTRAVRRVTGRTRRRGFLRRPAFWIWVVIVPALVIIHYAGASTNDYNCTTKNGCMVPPPAPVQVVEKLQNVLWVACKGFYPQSDAVPPDHEPVCHLDGSVGGAGRSRITLQHPAVVDLFFAPIHGVTPDDMPRFTPLNAHPKYAHIVIQYDHGPSVRHPTTNPRQGEQETSMPQFSVYVGQSVKFTVQMVCDYDYNAQDPSGSLCKHQDQVINTWHVWVRVVN